MVYIVSWNVAGWPTTSAAIRQHFTSISAFLSELQVDIFCIQESKVTRKRLNEEGFACGAEDRPGYPIAGFESFWSCCADRSFNGVTTFVRNGLTLRADDRPFDDQSLNDEGRCIVTYHSHFVVFNVYVPYAQHGLRQEFKSKFQSELRQAMIRARTTAGLPVILVGDLNLTYRIQDCHYTKRRLSLIHVHRFLSEHCEAKQHENKGFSSPLDVDTLASSAEYVAKLVVQHYSSKESSSLKASPCTTKTELINRLCEVIEKMGSDNLFVSVLQSTSNLHNAHLFLMSEYFGLPAHPKCDIAFMETLLKGDKMVDTFVVATEPSDATLQRCYGRWVSGMTGELSDPPINARYPLPFTAWDQYRNRRYDNDGNRIDYILVDEALASLVAKNLNAGSTDENTSVTADKSGLESTFFSAFCGKGRNCGVLRATAGGGYVPAPVDGSGLQPLAPTLIRAPMREKPRTGLLITPPQYSDHIGVTLVLEGIELQQRPVSVGLIDANRSLFRRSSRNLLEMFAKKSASNDKEKRPRDDEIIIIN